jgi:SdpI/YfhL protein family
MDAVAIAVGAGWTFAGLLCLGLSIPLIRGWVGRNRVYGVRLPQSFESEDAWLAINRFGGRRMAIWSIPLIVVGVVSFFLPLRAHAGLTLVLGFGPLVFVLIPVIETWRFARRYGRGA